MVKRFINLEYKVYSSNNIPDYENLCSCALRARENSYAPYSHFTVGAALLLANGAIVSGSNQENCASPSGSCAERVALNTAAQMYPGIKICACAIVGGQFGQEITRHPTTPCGNCRQLFLEQIKRQGEDIRMCLLGMESSYLVWASSLLPLSFNL